MSHTPRRLRVTPKYTIEAEVPLTAEDADTIRREALAALRLGVIVHDQHITVRGHPADVIDDLRSALADIRGDA